MMLLRLLLLLLLLLPHKYSQLKIDMNIITTMKNDAVVVVVADAVVVAVVVVVVVVDVTAQKFSQSSLDSSFSRTYFDFKFNQRC
jgi:hypothetical protein